MTMVETMTLRELLEANAGIHSSTELRAKIGGSSAQVSNLWHGRDPIGARLMLRILTAFPQITAEALSQVKEAEKALTPPRHPPRHRSPKRSHKRVDPAAAPPGPGHGPQGAREES